jgi:hypothetical protein
LILAGGFPQVVVFAVITPDEEIVSVSAMLPELQESA